MTYQEILQGARNENEAKQLQAYLSTQKIFYLPDSLDFYNQAAALRQRLRNEGSTIRNTIDILIATTAIHHNLQLLHNDRDFDLIAKSTPELKIFGKTMQT